jgi:hypothetical protein
MRGNFMDKSTQTLKNQQLRWLEEAYPALIRVAQAIILESVTIAEDITSDAVMSTLNAIRGGRCSISAKSRFVSYCKRLVRLKSRNAFTRYDGDIKRDVAKAYVARQLRPDVRQTAVLKAEDDAFNPYERVETVE